MTEAATAVPEATATALTEATTLMEVATAATLTEATERRRRQHWRMRLRRRCLW
jgi:hypothetical protein